MWCGEKYLTGINTDVRSRILPGHLAYYFTRVYLIHRRGLKLISLNIFQLAGFSKSRTESRSWHRVKHRDSSSLHLHAIPCGQVSVHQPLSVKILDPFGSLKCHFHDFLRGECSRWPFAAQFAPHQEPLHVLVTGVRVQEKRSASILDRDAQNWEQGRMAQTVQG